MDELVETNSLLYDRGEAGRGRKEVSQDKAPN